MANEAEDVNTEQESSTSSGEMGDSPSQDQETSVDESAQNQSLTEFVSGQLNDGEAATEEKGSSPEGDTEETEEKIGDDEESEADESDSENESDEKEKKESDEDEESEDDEATDEKEDVDGEEEERKPVPYDRFKEVNDKYTQLKEQTAQTADQVKNYQNIVNFCRSHNITPKQFDDVLEVQALLNSDPEEALNRLQPIVDGLKGLTGDRLPADIQKKVDDNVIDLETARELAQHRARLKFGESKMKHDRQMMEQQRETELQRDYVRTAQQWDAQKRQTDPDYAPKKKESDVDGKFEMVKDKYLSLINQLDGKGQYVNPVRNSEEMLALLERAYNSVSQVFKSRLVAKKPATRKVLPSNGSSKVSTKKTVEGSKTMAEGVMVGLARRGYDVQ